ncbi:MAG: quinone-dependent dihydroorotate dehydrogenase [Thermonemataceae bacterium]
MYKWLVRPLLFSLDAEKAHNFTFRLVKTLFKIPGVPALLGALYRFKHPKLKREVMGLSFDNPVGLAAGFDKNAVLIDEMAQLGFGFIEIGTVTPRPQAGNPQPRLFRLVTDEAIINRMGFNNEGMEALVKRLKKRKTKVIIGGNIGKNKTTPNEEALRDYEACFEELFEVVDYFVVNVSSPNTPNLRALQEKEPLTRLLHHLQVKNQAKANPKPILLKIAPDLSNAQLDDIVEIVKDTQIAGVIATNTTISREELHTPTQQVAAIGAGGLSGKPLTQRSTEVIRYLHERAAGAFPIIGVGGIHNAQDALDKIAAGASLVQLYTGFVYEGPALCKKINQALAQL